MSSASALPATDVPFAPLQQSPTTSEGISSRSCITHNNEDYTSIVNNITEWPALSPSKILSSVENFNYADVDWEMLPDHHDASQTSFEIGAVRVVEPLQGETNANNDGETRHSLLHHCQSTPDFRHGTILEETDNVEAVLIENSNKEDEGDGSASFTSSSMVMVSGPTSSLLTNCWSGASPSKILFRDAILKKKQEQDDIPDQPSTNNTIEGSSSTQDQQVQQKIIKKKKPKFVVTPIKRCTKSTGDLRSFTQITESDYHHDDGGGGDVYNDKSILGDTDTELFYNQKAQGRLGRTNGKKVRPDEQKRLKMIMAKKKDQQQRQLAASSTKKKR
mmetsp:Transcript_22466/g.24025  ORF Transcript_22466/g.24025 Transcript_22466/m.24025 type:complete len:333 (-) Transcript_22466:169-1167(-)